MADEPITMRHTEIRDGVSDAMWRVTKEELLAAIRDGVADAMWRMITNATDAPCADFYEAVKQGIKGRGHGDG